MSFQDVRLDVAELAATAMGITVTSTWSTNPEAHIGQVRWGGNGRDWFERDEETNFGHVASNLSILITANYADPKGAAEFLETKVQALLEFLDAGQPLTRTGGTCPPVMTTAEPARLADAGDLIGALVTLYPLEHQP